MKKKFVVALVAAMSLTVAGTGTVFAMNNFHIHGENCEWVVDKAAYDEVVKHPEEGHYEKVEVSPEEGHFETVHHEEEGHYENGKLLEEEKGHYEEVVITPGWTENKYVVDRPAWTEEVVHPAETKQEWVVDKEAWTETIAKYKCVCNGCHAEFASDEEWIAHSKENAMNGDYNHMGYTNVPYYETVEHPEEGHYETVVVKPSWTETVEHPEEGHYEKVEHPAVTEQKWVVDKPAVYEQVWVVDKPAWDEEVWVVDKEAVYEDKWIVDKEAWEETIHHKEEGHWVCNGEPQKPEQKPENPDQKPEQPENPDQKPEQPENPDQKPEQPENPDQKPEQPENPDQKPEQPENPDVETPETPDAENQATPEQKPEANKENVQTQATETKKEGTSPKTGDTTSALPVAGAGLASLGVALATILKKRK